MIQPASVEDGKQSPCATGPALHLKYNDLAAMLVRVNAVADHGPPSRRLDRRRDRAPWRRPTARVHTGMLGPRGTEIIEVDAATVKADVEKNTGRTSRAAGIRNRVTVTALPVPRVPRTILVARAIKDTTPAA